MFLLFPSVCSKSNKYRAAVCFLCFQRATEKGTCKNLNEFNVLCKNYRKSYFYVVSCGSSATEQNKPYKLFSTLLATQRCTRPQKRAVACFAASACCCVLAARIGFAALKFLRCSFFRYRVFFRLAGDFYPPILCCCSVRIFLDKAIALPIICVGLWELHS